MCKILQQSPHYNSKEHKLKFLSNLNCDESSVEISPRIILKYVATLQHISCPHLATLSLRLLTVICFSVQSWPGYATDKIICIWYCISLFHYDDVIMGAMASQITSLTIVYSTVCSKKTSKLRITGLCAENSLVTSEFPAQMASNAENVSISWRHHVLFIWAVLRWCAKVINSHSATRFHVIYDTVLLCFVYMSSSQLILQSYLRGNHEAITHYWPLYQDTL